MSSIPFVIHNQDVRRWMHNIIKRWLTYTFFGWPVTDDCNSLTYFPLAGFAPRQLIATKTGELGALRSRMVWAFMAPYLTWGEV